jgi:hypothetical protein
MSEASSYHTTANIHEHICKQKARLFRHSFSNTSLSYLHEPIVVIKLSAMAHSYDFCGWNFE